MSMNTMTLLLPTIHPSFVSCLECGGVIAPKSPNVKFCSRACSYKGAAKNGLDTRLLNKEFTAKRYIRPGRSPKYIPRHVLTNTKNLNEPEVKGYIRTEIEERMHTLLSEMGLIFKEQLTLLAATRVDFYIPKYHLVIYCDGEYWHQWPIGLKKDKLQASKLPEFGFKVLRFWEYNILHDLPECKQIIISAINDIIPVAKFDYTLKMPFVDQ